MIRLTTARFTVLWLLIFSAVTTVTQLSAAEIKDLSGRQVTVPDRIGRIIALRGALSIICYMNLADRVVGVEHHETAATRWLGAKGRPYRLANPQLGKLPITGSRNKPQPEKIIGLHPDLIFIGKGALRMAKQLERQTGIPVVVLDLGDLGSDRNKFYQSLQLVGKICGKPERAQALIDKITRSLADLQKRTAQIKVDRKKKVYLGGIQFKVAHGILGTSRDYPPFQMVNAENVVDSLLVTKKLIKGRLSIKRETFLSLDPEVIFVCESGLQLVADELRGPLYRNLPAVAGNRVFGLLPHYYATAPATVLAEAYYIGKVLYPERFQDIEIAELADKLYTFFLGSPLYKKMAEIFGGFKPLVEIE